MCSDVAIRAQNLGKIYPRFDHPIERLKRLLWPHRFHAQADFVALRNVSLDVAKGEVIGLIGRNGAGKSTLLQLICGTLAPSTGTLAVNGRISALLELGAGFNSEFSGRENIYLSAAVMGLKRAQIDARYEEIVEFSGIRAFIDQAVKTYSSGMYMRLAFAVATSIDPDILVIDEALSVGDGEFARRSFDRIMALKDGGATVLFCSHSMYHIEALCQRAVWLHEGEVRACGPTSAVVAQYGDYLQSLQPGEEAAATVAPAPAPAPALDEAGLRLTRLVRIELESGAHRGQRIVLDGSGQALTLWVDFVAAAHLPPPSLAYEIRTRSGISVHSGASVHDGHAMPSAGGPQRAGITFPALPLMPGEYSVSVYLSCERVLHVYDAADTAAWIEMRCERKVPGIVTIEHRWHR